MRARTHACLCSVTMDGRGRDMRLARRGMDHRKNDMQGAKALECTVRLVAGGGGKGRTALKVGPGDKDLHLCI